MMIDRLSMIGSASLIGLCGGGTSITVWYAGFASPRPRFSENDNASGLKAEIAIVGQCRSIPGPLMHTE